MNLWTNVLHWFFNAAIQLNIRSLEIARSLSHTEGVAATLHQLAGVEFVLMNYAKAKSYWEESIQLFRDLGDITRQSISSLMLVQLEKIIGNANQAIALAGTAAKELGKLKHPQADFTGQFLRKMEEYVVNEK